MTREQDRLTPIMRRADETLAAARALWEKGYLTDAASRAYYAVFHGMTALLESRGIRRAHHHGTIAEFSRVFVKTGIFPKEFGKVVRRLYETREEGDYDYSFEPDAEQCARDIEDASRILLGFKDYLRRETGPNPQNAPDS